MTRAAGKSRKLLGGAPKRYALGSL